MVDLGPVSAAQVTAVTGFKPEFDRLAARGITVSTDLPEAADVAIAFLPRSRPRALARIAALLTLLPPSGVLVIDGQKSDGIDAVLKAIDKGIPLAGRVSRSHGKTGWLIRPDQVPPGIASWAASTAQVDAEGLISAPGMFSAGELDPGSLALIGHLPRDLTGTAADFGAGWGALSDALLKANPGLTSLDAVEADHASTEAAHMNLTDPRARVHWADVTRWPGGPYDIIVMNPPFHGPRGQDTELGAAFIRAAASALAPRGTLYMVANRHLPYERTLGEAFAKVEELGADPAYKIHRATRPTAARARKRH